MSSQAVPIHRIDANSTNETKKDDVWFNPFDFAPDADKNIRWLSRPNQELARSKYSNDIEKFRITFDVENFQSDKIKIYIQNQKLTISGVYEERSEGRFMQKQFERNFDLPSNVDIRLMAAYITSANMLVVEIPISTTPIIDHLSINTDSSNQRRLSFSLNKFDTTQNQGLFPTLNDTPNLAAPAQEVRRTSITKTTTTTTTSGSSDLPPEIAQLLKNIETTTGTTSQTHTTHTTEHHLSNTGNQQIIINEPSTATTSNKQTTVLSSNLSNLPIEIPPELLASGGTITIQRRKVSVSRGSDNTGDQQPVPVPITRSNETQSTTNTLNQSEPSQTTEGRDSKTISSTNQSRMLTLEEFLENKIWNPSLSDGSDGKKILHMRLQMKPGTTSDQMKISLNGFDLRVEVNNKISTDGGRSMSEHSYRQITLFPTCEIDKLKTEFKDDGFLHIQVPMKL